MTRDNLRSLVWEALLNSDSMCRYYGYLASRLERRERQLSVLVAVLASGTLAVLLYRLRLPFLPEILALLTTVFSVYFTVQKHSKGAMLSASIRTKLARIQTEYELLWDQFDGLEVSEISERWRHLQDREADIVEIASVEFVPDMKLAERCHDEVLRARGLAETT